MKKRSDIIISLLHDPDILILDEPFSGLDFALTHFLWNQIKYLSKRGKIIIISSHFLKELQENCQKLGFVERGFFYNNKQIKEGMKKHHLSSLEALFT
jgi:ABC-2 type transport system ATP-binding protein